MKFLNAQTFELEEPEAAVKEILGQLEPEKNLLAHSLGVLTCSYDFVETGVVKALCEALPFDVIGGTTLTNANNLESGTMLLCLTVLTSNDCGFAAALTEPLDSDMEEKISAAVKKAKDSLNEPEKMSLAFYPMFGVGGELLLDSLDAAIGETPIFGTVACDYDTSSYANTYTIFNGENYTDRISFALISGNIKPRFVMAATSEQNLKKQQAQITSSDGCLLKQVNNMSAKDYFSAMGLMSGKGVEGMSSVPFVVDYGDGAQPVARAIYSINDDGSALCGGVMPEGGTLYIGLMDVDDILLTAEKSVQKLTQTDDINGIIMFPCLGRNMVLALDPFAEIETIKKAAGDIVPWHLAYSAGECCPVYNKNGELFNRFHNFTFIGCAF